MGSASSGQIEEGGGRRLGRYLVTATLGSGAMGEVLRARDERLGREVAIKTVRNVFGMQAALFRQRFEAEARALAALSHPAVVAVHDLGFEPPPDGEPYLVMELVEGPSLKDRLAAGAMSPAEVRAMGIQLARGLEVAHARQILHRDLKPANILQVRATGQWKLADFGVAHVPDSSVTMTGQFLGTPAYAAPEALGLGQFSEASDVFGLAVTLVEAVIGRRLRGEATLSELVRQGGEAVMLPPEVPPDLARTLRPALALEPGARPSAARLAERLASAEAVDDGTAVLGPASGVATPPVLRPEATPAPGGVTPALGPAGLAAAAARSSQVLGTAATSPGAASLATATAALGTAATFPGYTSPSGTMVIGDPARRRRTRLIAGLAGGVVVIGLVAALAGSGGSGGQASTARPTPSAMPVRAREPDPAWAPRAPMPSQITVRYPQGLDRRGLKEFEKVVKKVREGDYGEALDKLDGFEARFGASSESGFLRAQLERLPRYDD
jgi:eukaryotic-like serine/threonine-protein kinase